MFELPENILPVDGTCKLINGFLSAKEAERYFHKLQEEIKWQQYHIQIFGKKLPQPRLTAWYGEKGANYSYSGLQLEPIPFSTDLQKLKLEIEKKCGTKFNSVLINLYRNQRDSMGWHSDDEKELGPNPNIASLSLGCSRIFQLRHKTNKSLKTKLELSAGSLLCMGGTMQKHWQHAIPKSLVCCKPRINLTFRNILS